jgi:hypothetical protein
MSAGNPQPSSPVFRHGQGRREADRDVVLPGRRLTELADDL